jgi:HNH endonuclease
MLHILLGNAGEDVGSVFDAAKNNTSLDWIVPKKASIYDRALFHLPQRGFVARGLIDSQPKSKNRTLGRYVAGVRSISLLPASVPLTFIGKHHTEWEWPSFPRSYTSVEGSIESRLDELLEGYQGSLIEGSVTSTWVTSYERNSTARRECIEHYGAVCAACGFSFGETYGQTAEGYIHVHHLNNVSSRGGEYVIDPIRDLRPVCPNCHVVLHLQTPPLSIQELKRMLRNAKPHSA